MSTTGAYSGVPPPLHFLRKEVATSTPRRAAPHDGVLSAASARRRRRSAHAQWRPSAPAGAAPMTSNTCAASERDARAQAWVPFSPRLPAPVGPAPRRHEGDAAFKLRAPLPPPRHRGEEGRRPGAAGRGGARWRGRAWAGPRRARDPWGMCPVSQVLSVSSGSFSRLRTRKRPLPTRVVRPPSLRGPAPGRPEWLLPPCC